MKHTSPFLLAITLFVAGCGAESDSGASAAPVLPERYLLSAEPAGAVDVAAARAAARAAAATGGELVVRGVVGGSPTPFVEGLAAFTIVDAGLANSCLSEGDHCPTSWDYCCVDPSVLRERTLTVEFRDGGTPLAAGARGFRGLDHLSQVVVAGRAEVDDHGNVTVVAAGIFLP